MNPINILVSIIIISFITIISISCQRDSKCNLPIDIGWQHDFSLEIDSPKIGEIIIKKDSSLTIKVNLFDCYGTMDVSIYKNDILLQESKFIGKDTILNDTMYTESADGMYLIPHPLPHYEPKRTGVWIYYNPDGSIKNKVEIK